jgi:hypothetical protein
MDTTYTNSHRNYYEQNKDKINDRRRNYNRTYAASYYEQHKTEINEKRRNGQPRGRPRKVSTDLTPENE